MQHIQECVQHSGQLPVDFVPSKYSVVAHLAGILLCLHVMWWHSCKDIIKIYSPYINRITPQQMLFQCVDTYRLDNQHCILTLYFRYLQPIIFRYINPYSPLFQMLVLASAFPFPLFNIEHYNKIITSHTTSRTTLCRCKCAARKKIPGHVRNLHTGVETFSLSAVQFYLCVLTCHIRRQVVPALVCSIKNTFKCAHICSRIHSTMFRILALACRLSLI
jgi:hypothetical protein